MPAADEPLRSAVVMPVFDGDFPLPTEFLVCSGKKKYCFLSKLKTKFDN